MKIAVLNYSGNVGKTTIAQHMLAPRLEGATVISVESINADGSSDKPVRGKEFGELSEALGLLGDTVVDVGASNVEDFLERMAQYRGSHEDYDLFVVPTVPKVKQMRDTIATIAALSELGIPAERIRVVFNMLEPDDQLERMFPGVLNYAAAERKFLLRTDAVIRVNDLYGRLRDMPGQTIAGVLADKDDLKAMLLTAPDIETKLRISQRISIKRLAAGVTEELDRVFQAVVR